MFDALRSNALRERRKLSHGRDGERRGVETRKCKRPLRV